MLETYICVRDVMCCRVERGDQAVSSGMLHHVVAVKKVVRLRKWSCERKCHVVMIVGLKCDERLE